MESMSWFICGMIFGWFATLTAFALGAYVVFKTKREPYDQMFSMNQPKGDAFNLEDDFEEPKETPEMPSIVGKMNSRFQEQMKGDAK